MQTPPGPRSLLPGRFLRAMQRAPIPFFTKLARDYGDAARFRIGPQTVMLFNYPDLIRDLLVTHDRSFHKSRVLQRAKSVFGEGLLTSEGAFHLRQRRLAQPAFHRERIARYADVMIDRAAKLRETWRDGEVVDIHQQMMRVTLSIVAKTLFDAEVESEAGEIGAALGDLVELFPLLMNPFVGVMRRLPLPSTRRFNRALARLDRTIYAIIDERRRSTADRGDLLSMLLVAVDEEGDGGGMSDKQLRDEAMTLFLAGHETTANALAWTWMLLAQNRDAAGEVCREVDALGATPAPADYARLAFTEMVFAESMRLYPPAWAVSRLAIDDVTIGGWRVPRGAVVAASQAVMHRDARYWNDPDVFEPRRFTSEAKAARPRFAYFPFGAGPRICIGESFAWMEGVLMLATIAQSWRMELLANDVTPQASITLRPKGGIPMRLVRR